MEGVHVIIGNKTLVDKLYTKSSGASETALPDLLPISD